MFFGIVAIIDFIVTLVTVASSIAALVAKLRANDAKAKRLLRIGYWGLFSFLILVLLGVTFHIPLFPGMG
jgi:hypothetical protein